MSDQGDVVEEVGPFQHLGAVLDDMNVVFKLDVTFGKEVIDGSFKLGALLFHIASVVKSSVFHESLCL